MAWGSSALPRPASLEATSFLSLGVIGASEYLLLFSVETLFDFGCIWVCSLLWLLAFVVGDEAGWFFLEICEPWLFPAKVSLALVGGRFGWWRVEEGVRE